MVKIEASGAMFNAAKDAAHGDFDQGKAFDRACGKKLGAITMALKTTASDEGMTEALVRYGRGQGGIKEEYLKRIDAVAALRNYEDGIKEIGLDDKTAINPINFDAALVCLRGDEEKAALRVQRLRFILEKAKNLRLDWLIKGHFGGNVRQAVSGGWARVANEKMTGYWGMATAAKLALEAIEKRL